MTNKPKLAFIAAVAAVLFTAPVLAWRLASGVTDSSSYLFPAVRNRVHLLR
jgi:hypothetical protein